MMIEVENLTKEFGHVTAIDQVTFSIEKGEVVGFLGLNGAGKTTTMRILTTYLPATSGIAKVAGYDVMQESMDVRRNVGYLPENVPLYQEMRVEEYLQFRAKMKKVARKEQKKRIEHCLGRCRLEGVRRRLIRTLSKGYRQRVGLADALIHNPPILILDEPTAGLDPLQKRETLALIKELGENHTIMLSTHILSEVEAICQRVIIIYQGRVGVAKKMSDLERDGRILVEVRGAREEVTKVLEDLHGVSQVQSYKLKNGLARYELRTEGEEDLREEISEALVKAGHPIRRLDVQRASLEEEFLGMMREDDPLRQATEARIKGETARSEKSQHVKASQ